MRRPLPITLFILAAALAGLFALRFWPRKPAPRAPAAEPRQPAKAEVTLYFANRAYVQTGDETQPVLREEKRTVTLGRGGLAEAAIRALQAGPRSAEASPVIGKNIRVIGVRVNEGVAEVNLARENLSGGSLEEMLLIRGVAATLTGLSGVDAVRFLVDGKPAETLMGHYSADQPITAKDLE